MISAPPNSAGVTNVMTYIACTTNYPCLVFLEEADAAAVLQQEQYPEAQHGRSPVDKLNWWRKNTCSPSPSARLLPHFGRLTCAVFETGYTWQEVISNSPKGVVCSWCICWTQDQGPPWSTAELSAISVGHMIICWCLNRERRLDCEYWEPLMSGRIFGLMAMSSLDLSSNWCCWTPISWLRG